MQTADLGRLDSTLEVVYLVAVVVALGLWISFAALGHRNLRYPDLDLLALWRKREP